MTRASFLPAFPPAVFICLPLTSISPVPVICQALCLGTVVKLVRQRRFLGEHRPMRRQPINKETNTNCNKFSRRNKDGAQNKIREAVGDLNGLFKGTLESQ